MIALILLFGTPYIQAIQCELLHVLSRFLAVRSLEKHNLFQIAKAGKPIEQEMYLFLISIVQGFSFLCNILTVFTILVLVLG